jgi:activating signal cointegrator 1
MFVLSLLQPWASLIIMGVKTIETRRWQTAHRGPLLIHAGQRKAGESIALEPPIAKYIPHFNQLPFGAIIGQINLVDIVPVESLPLSTTALASQSLELNAFGDESINRFAWLLEDAIMFNKPIPARGHLHLWQFSLEPSYPIN